MAERKSRNYGFILYPEGNEDMVLVIQEMHVPTVISPLHDSDVWTPLDQAKDASHVAGTLKPPHWHGMFLFDGPARLSQALSCLERFSNPTHHVEPLSSLISYARYMLHLDNPEKAQYKFEDMGFYNGAVVSLERPMTPEEEDIQTDEILSWVRDYNIVEYADLVLYAMDNRPDWNRNVRKHTVFWRGFFNSHRFTCVEDPTVDDIIA